MPTKRPARPKGADDGTLPLFGDFELPPSAKAMTDIRGLKRPVWTEQKAKLIARYLKLFTMVTKHGTYIDGFAGRQSKHAKQGWAAELVLDNRPRWLRRFYLCDEKEAQLKGLAELKDRQLPMKKKEGRREIQVLSGDFNKTVYDILATRKLDPATFCLLDQRTFECKWATVEALANHRPDGQRIELFYFLPIHWLDRAIHATTRNHAEIDTWWGGQNWKHLVDLQTYEKALAFQQKFAAFGYRTVHPFPIFDQDTRRIMFYMILASDHPEAHKLMWRAYHSGVHDEKGWDQITLL